MRLIDADKLKAVIIEGYKAEFFGSVLWDILDDIPTAYDINKVVEELENYRSQYEKIWLGINDDVERRIYVAKGATMYDAIEIVKQGLEQR